MPPKIKVTKDDIINAAVEIVRSKGAQAINARAIAAELNCSTQPVYSNFATIDELRLAVVDKAEELSREYMRREAADGRYPAYKAGGMAYIRFAKEEKELFKLLYMRDRSGEVIPESTDLSDEMESIVHKQTGLSGLDVKLFHLEMWAFVHGIAVMFATGYVELDPELVSKMLTDSYQGLRKQYGME